MTQLTNIRGVVHGRTIELEEELTLLDGESVTMTITPEVAVSESKQRQEKLAAAAGALAGLDDEIDAFNEWYRSARHSDPRAGSSLE